MSDLVVIAFPTESKAEEVRQKLLAMQKEYLIELGDAVVAVKDAEGRSFALPAAVHHAWTRAATPAGSVTELIFGP